MLKIVLLSAVTMPQLGLGLSTPATFALAEDLNVSVPMVQETLVIYMVGYAISMVFSGLLSDRLSPRTVQIWGLRLSSVAALICTLAPNLLIFSIARLLQALGGCVSTVTTGLIVKEEYPERDRINILTTLTSAIAITPVMAPLLGGTLVPHIGWRGIFVVIATASVLVLIFFASATRGITPPPTKRPRLKQVLTIYRRNYVIGSIAARFLSACMDIDVILMFASATGCLGGTMLIAATTLAPEFVYFVTVPMVIILFAVGMVIPASQAGLLR